MFYWIILFRRSVVENNLYSLAAKRFWKWSDGPRYWKNGKTCLNPTAKRTSTLLEALRCSIVKNRSSNRYATWLDIPHTSQFPDITSLRSAITHHHKGFCHETDEATGRFVSWYHYHEKTDLSRHETDISHSTSVSWQHPFREPQVVGEDYI